MKSIYNQEFHDSYYYNGNDLGYIYSNEETKFRLWAPVASAVTILFYKEGHDTKKSTQIKEVDLVQGEKGTWIHTEQGDIKGWFYTYKITNGNETCEVVDPYVKATGVNGLRGFILDLNETNPKEFHSCKGPILSKPTDAVIYELHVRDLSMSRDSNIKNKGKFLGLTELGTKNSNGETTGLSHIMDLGVTHIHLLPIYDFGSIDESKLEENNFNWGYDPMNYNVVEGSYATNPFDGSQRIKELKEMIHTLHRNGLGVIMDVVYNHTYYGEDSNLNKTVPYYYHRMIDNKFSDGSACGNETASEMPMMRKYMIDSLCYWAKEFNFDGFRFDLMGLHDIDTMNEIRSALNKINPNILIYGEGWTGGDTPLLESDRAIKSNVSKLNQIAVFSDDIRDGIKGSVFDEMDCGFVNGGKNLKETIKYGIVGGIEHFGIDQANVKGTKKAYATHPSQVVNYTSAHDNLTLWDKLNISCYGTKEEELIKMNVLSISIVMTSMGIPFFQAGEELLRSKKKEDGTFEENSYKSSDKINSIPWDNKTKYKNVFNHYKELIALRKEHSGLRMATREEVLNNLDFIDHTNLIVYTISNDLDSKGLGELLILHNGEKEDIIYPLVKENYHLCYASGTPAEAYELYDAQEVNTIRVAGISSVILKRYYE